MSLLLASATAASSEGLEETGMKEGAILNFSSPSASTAVGFVVGN